jgi:RimJ/RimL family protein N-acetyltransferase
MVDQTKIRTKRLALRAMREDDIPRLAQIGNDLDIARMTSSMPHPFGPDEAAAFVCRGRSMDLAEERLFAIETENDGVVGALGFYETGGFGPELGYWLGRPYWGRGYASEAAKGASDWAHEDWEKKVVIAGHFADNPASGAVLCKAGFLYTGEVQLHPSKARGEPARSRMMVRLG